MSSIAKHIRVAQTQGPEAGMEFYLAAPSSRRHPAYAEITRKRTPETQLKAYCSIFADKLASVPSRVPVVQERVMDDQQGIMEAFAEWLAQRDAGNSEDEAVVEAAPVVTFVTAGEAWARLIELGDDPDFPAPKDTEKPATNGQLYRLNAVYGAVSIS